MSRHDGVSCDGCLKENFSGKRYKCLICPDYDLCEICFENLVLTGNHNNSHAMQCILTRNDCELYYGGESFLNYSQSFTCPFCANKGFTEPGLIEHVTINHGQAIISVICPICVSTRTPRLNLIREDFIGHLHLEHRYSSRELVSLFDETPRQIVHWRHMRPRPTRGRGATINFSTQSFRENRDQLVTILSEFVNGRPAQSSVSLSTPSATQPSRNVLTDSTSVRTVACAPCSITPSPLEQSRISLQSGQTQCNSQFLIPAYLQKQCEKNKNDITEEEKADRTYFISKLIFDIFKQNLSKSNEAKDPISLHTNS